MQGKWAKYEPSDEPLSTGTNAIYVLVDPRDETVRYVGKARHFERRRRQHSSGDLALEKNKHLLAWKKELRALGISPSMHVVARCSESRWQAAEQWWIGHYRSKGRICNIQPGGLLRAVVNAGGNFVRWETAPSYGTTAPRAEHKKGRRRKAGAQLVGKIDPATGIYLRDFAEPRSHHRKKKKFKSKIWVHLGRLERRRLANKRKQER